MNGVTRLLGLVLLLTILAGDGSHQVKGSSASSVDEEHLAHSLHTLLREKMAEAREIVLHGHSSSDLRPIDPFHLDALNLMVQEPKGFVNVSLKKVTVNGLGNFQVKDIATNFDLMRTSVLLHFPELQLSATYRLKGFLNPPFSQSLSDEGHFEATIADAGATWAGRVDPSGKGDGDALSLTQTAFRTYWDGATHLFRSFMRKRPLVKAGELLQAVSSAVVEKIQRMAEEAFEAAISHVMGKGQSSWQMAFPVAPAPRNDEVDGEHRHSIKKRQVPCENGEELDEYVDTLIRFGRRLIRFMEPVPFPNTTIKIDDVITVFLYNGGVRGASNLSRKKPAYVKCTNTTTTLGMVVQLENLRVSAKYRVLQDYRLLLFNGEADIKIKDVVVLVQITQFMNGETRQQLDRLKIWKLGHVTVRLRGLGNLTSALSMLLSYQINEDPHAVIPVAEAQITTVIRQQLNNVTIPIFSII